MSLAPVAKPDRIPCEVLGCRRTAAKARYEPDTRIICGKCWRLGSAETRRIHADAGKRLRRLESVAARSGVWNLQFLSEILAQRWELHIAFDRICVEASEARAGLA